MTNIRSNIAGTVHDVLGNHPILFFWEPGNSTVQETEWDGQNYVRVTGIRRNFLPRPIGQGSLYNFISCSSWFIEAMSKIMECTSWVTTIAQKGAFPIVPKQKETVAVFRGPRSSKDQLNQLNEYTDVPVTWAEYNLFGWNIWRFEIPDTMEIIRSYDPENFTAAHHRPGAGSEKVNELTNRREARVSLWSTDDPITHAPE